jgi:hypothetical protein
LIQLRDWEVGWLTGPFVGKEGQLVSLTGPERQRIYLEQTLTTPGAYLKRVFIAGIDQARGWPSQWDDGWGGYAERFAPREGQFMIANSWAALGNAKLGYEVRYDQQWILAKNPSCDRAKLRDLRPERAREASAVGVVWRGVRRRFDLDSMEAASAGCLCRSRARRSGSGGLGNSAELLHRICR